MESFVINSIEPKGTINGGNTTSAHDFIYVPFIASPAKLLKRFVIRLIVRKRINVRKHGFSTSQNKKIVYCTIIAPK